MHSIWQKTSDNFKLYPNPADQFVNLKFDHGQSAKDIAVFTVNGKKIIEKEIANGYSHKLLTSKLDSGVYIMRITDMSSRRTFSRKLIIDR